MKQNKRHQTKLISVIIVIITVALLVFLALCLYKQPSLAERYDAIIKWLAKLENAVVGLDSKFEIVICILALYIARCRVPIPFGVLCVIPGLVFSFTTAIVVNVAGLSLYFLIKYFEGSWMGAGILTVLLNARRAKFIKEWILFKGSGNPYILVASRCVPTISPAVISILYGSMHYDIIYFLVLSIVGFMPRLYIYTRIGSVLYNPFSKEFIILLMIIVAFSGITSLIFNIFYGIKSRQMTQTLLIYSQKQKYKIVL